jgi:lactate permease
VMAGVKGAVEVLPAIIACGVTFAGMQFFVSNFIGPELTDILASLTSIGAMVLVMKMWHPKNIFRLEGDKPVVKVPQKHTSGEIVLAWMPYALLVVFVLLWGYKPMAARLNTVTKTFAVPGLDKMIQRMPPVTRAPQAYPAPYTFNWLSASGTSCFLATVAAALLLGVRPRQFLKTYVSTYQQLKLPMVTIATMLALAYLMNYSGMTSTLGLALAATGGAFPFFSSILGWMGVFLTGSDTSANALFGNLQVVTANALGINPVLTASVNSAGGVMGKMISLSSIAVAVAATGMASSDEGKLFRFTLKHSILLASVIGVIAMAYAYLAPGLIPVATPK